MAYSDYGGYAYRNGVRVIERSDATITPEGDTFGTPGAWPGFGMIAAGIDANEIKKRIQWPHGHAVLGDGPIYVVLYKQSGLSIYRGPERLDETTLLTTQDPEALDSYEIEGQRVTYVNDEHFKASERPCEFAVDGWTCTVYWRKEDNHYQYVRLVQPDGNVWHGWSGYGVGAGLEDCGYGYSTQDREDMLWELLPLGVTVEGAAK